MIKVINETTITNTITTTNYIENNINYTKVVKQSFKDNELISTITKISKNTKDLQSNKIIPKIDLQLKEELTKIFSKEINDNLNVLKHVKEQEFINKITNPELDHLSKLSKLLDKSKYENMTNNLFKRVNNVDEDQKEIEEIKKLFIDFSNKNFGKLHNYTYNINYKKGDLLSCDIPELLNYKEYNVKSVLQEFINKNIIYFVDIVQKTFSFYNFKNMI